MIAVDANEKEFVRLLEVAIAIAEKMKSDAIASGSTSWVSESIDVTVENLKGFRDTALSGKLPSPSKGEVPQGTGLGLIRGVGEWTEDNSLLDAVYEAEDYYKKSM